MPLDMRNLRNTTGKSIPGRRSFLSSLGLGAVLAAAHIEGFAQVQDEARVLPETPSQDSDIGSIYDEIAILAGQSHYPLSFLEASYPSIDLYRRAVREKVFELFHYAPPPVPPAPETVGRWEYPDYIQEKVLFSTAPWFRVPAYVLTPKGRSGSRPGIIDLHSHGGMFVFGKEKVMPTPEEEHPSLTSYRQANYEGRSTSLALCRRGYVVISIDTFYFGERRTLFADDIKKCGRDRSKYSGDDVQYLNQRASEGEGILARSLFWAGTTWQGIAHWDDIRTVDYLQSRSEVDPHRIGCLGISMGGNRTDYLAGLDERIKCAVAVGWMSTFRPMIKNYVQTHSFMHFLPGLTHFLDLPDLIGCMAPRPLMVQQCAQDALYPLEGMKEAVSKLTAIYSKAGVPSMFRGQFYDQPHIFSLKMQEEAFAWMDRWLQP